MTRILWVDDQIDLLKPHILFLGQRGYEVLVATNGYDALEIVDNEKLDLVILDEMMPGLTGLETLPRIKEIAPLLPVIMITKSEEEDIMNRAVGSKIADYLIKPINPMQVLHSIKRNVHLDELVAQQSTSDYRADFGAITQQINSAGSFGDWTTIYKKLVGWDLELSQSSDRGVVEIMQYQKKEADLEFAKFIRRTYADWFDPQQPSGRESTRPMMSHNIMKNKVFEQLDQWGTGEKRGEKSSQKSAQKTLFLLIDNFRYDQWLTIRDLVAGEFDIQSEDFYCSIVPTATQYARNAIFAGLTPLGISHKFPKLWLNDNQEGGKNLHEQTFLEELMRTCGRQERLYFEKLARPGAGRKMLDNLERVYNADLSVIIYNFLDILSHARTETDIIRDIAQDEAAFRSLTRSWFEHSELFEILRRVARRGIRVIITSDHGTRKVENPVKVIGDRETSTNLRYKTGRNLGYDTKNLFVVSDPASVGLPQSNLSSQYIFALGDDFLVYPNNYNHFVRHFRSTFQHGGISMEEMIIPYITLTPR